MKIAGTIARVLLLPMIVGTVFLQAYTASAWMYNLGSSPLKTYVLAKMGVNSAWDLFVADFYTDFSQGWYLKLAFLILCLALSMWVFVNIGESIDGAEKRVAEREPLDKLSLAKEAIAILIGYCLLWAALIAIPGLLLYWFEWLRHKLFFETLWDIFLGIAAIVGLIASLQTLREKKQGA